MKHLLYLAAGAVLLASGGAQAGAVSGTLDFSNYAWAPSSETVNLATLLPSNLTITGATLTLLIGNAGYEIDAPVAGNYALQGTTLGPGSACPSGVSGWACEQVSLTWQRDNVTVARAIGQSASATLGSASASADNRAASPQITSQAGALHLDQQTSTGAGFIAGTTYLPDGTASDIPGYRTTIDTYYTQDVTQWQNRDPLALTLSFDAASLATLNGQRQFSYTLDGTALWGSFALSLNYVGVTSAVPEPTAAATLLPGLALLGIAGLRRRRREGVAPD